MKEIWVYVQLTNGDYEWQTVRAESLGEAVDKAAKIPGVGRVLEASFLPGGVIT